MVFQRNIYQESDQIVYPGKLSLTFPELGGTKVTPFLFLTAVVENMNQVLTYDYETEEVSGIGVIKFILRECVTKKIVLTELRTATPLLSMQDIFSPIAYLYPDTTAVTYPSGPENTKSDRQELNYSSEIGLPVIVGTHFETTETATFSGIPRYAIKGNWHFFGEAILCDRIDIFIRPKIVSGVRISSYSFL